MKYRDFGNTDEKLSAIGLGCMSMSTPSRLDLAWLLNRGDHIIPIPGTRRRKYLEENAGATDISLSADDMREIDSLLTLYPDVGSRYSENFAKQADKQ